MDECLKRLPAAEAKQRLSKLKAAVAAESDSQKKQALQRSLVTTLRPLARSEPDEYWKELQGLKASLSPFLQSQAIGYMADVEDPAARARIVEQVLAEMTTQGGAAKTGAADLRQFMQICSQLPMAARLPIVKQAIAKRQLKSKECLLVLSAPIPGPAMPGPPPTVPQPASPAALQSLAAADCVGLFRWAAMPAALSRPRQPTYCAWSIFSPPEESAASPGPAMMPATPPRAPAVAVPAGDSR